MAFGKYPVKVDIIEQRAGSLFVKKGRAARIEKKKGQIYYEIKLGRFKKAIKTKPIPYDYLYVTKGGYQAYIYSPAPNQYTACKMHLFRGKSKDMTKEQELKPMEIISCELLVDKAKIIAIDDDQRLFLVDSIIDANTRFKPLSFFHKYFPIISVVFLAIAFAILMFGASKYLDASMVKAGSIVGKLETILGNTQVVG